MHHALHVLDAPDHNYDIIVWLNREY